MDWFTWLSKTRLEPTLVYEYGLVFANNELEEEDIAYFNHEFLQSMGISIAKHRLEILKLARKEHKSYGFRNPMSKLFIVLKKTKKALAHYMATLVHHRDNDRALVLVSSQNKKINKGGGGGGVSYSSRWKREMMLRDSRKLEMENSSREILMLTNGDYLSDDHMVVSTPKLDSFSSPLMYDLQQSLEAKVHDDDFDDEEEHQYWSPTLEEVRWDAMFQDLKPT